MPVTRYHAALAWLDARPVADVLIDVEGGRFTAVSPGVPAPPGAVRLGGLTMPGLANVHSHAFHRALRGRTHAGRGTFWTWRDRMYAVAARPTVACTPRSRASLFAASTVYANASIGSWRSAIRVVPAWFASPVKSSRQRPCGQMEVATPTGAPRSTSARPCSMCSSTKVPMRPSRSGSAPRPDGSAPALCIASASVTPSRSVSRAARCGSTAPVSSREPRQATPNREPSSSVKTATPSGRTGTAPCSRSWSIASSPLTTPSGPS